MHFFAGFLTLIAMESFADPTVFRGYGPNSSCEEVIQAESGAGSRFVASIPDEIQPNGDVYDYIFVGEIFGSRAEIRVVCLDSNRPIHVEYEVLPQPPNAAVATELYVEFKQILTKLFGQPEDVILYHSSAYDSQGNLMPDAKPWRYVSSWCPSGMGIVTLTEHWHTAPDAYYVSGVGVDLIPCLPEKQD